MAPKYSMGSIDSLRNLHTRRNTTTPPPHDHYYLMRRLIKSAELSVPSISEETTAYSVNFQQNLTSPSIQPTLLQDNVAKPASGTNVNATAAIPPCNNGETKWRRLCNENTGTRAAIIF